MITVSITGDLPTMKQNPVPDAMEQVAKYMETAILANIAAGGRPDAWPPRKKDGAKALQGFAKDITSRFDDQSAQAGVFNALPKHYANQYGAQIHHPGSDKLQVFQIDGVTVFTRHTSPHLIPIPERPYVILQTEDVEEILKIVTNAIVRDVHGQPIH